MLFCFQCFSILLASKIFFFFQNIYPKQVVCLSWVWQDPALIAIGIHNEGKHWIIGRHKSCWNFSSEASAIFPSSTLFPWWLIRSPSSFLHLLSTSYIHSNRWCCYCCAPLLQLNKEPWSQFIYSTSSCLCTLKEDALEILWIFSIRSRCIPCQDANLGLLNLIVFSCFCQNSQHWGYKMMDEIPVKWSHHKQNLGFVPIMIRMETQKVGVIFYCNGFICFILFLSIDKHIMEFLDLIFI